MKNKNNEYLEIDIDPESHYKLRYISKYEGCSVNNQILNLICKRVKEFEEKEGEIKIDVDKK